MNYMEEVEQFLSKIQQTSDIPEYFIQKFKRAQQSPMMEKRRRIGIIGDSFYALYVRAFGLTPIFLNGGSYYAGENVSHMFPQISDPVAKATLGLFLDEDMGLYKEVDTVLIAVTNDSYKKAICYLEELGIRVIEVNMPSYVMEKMPLSYVMQQVGILNELSKIINTRISERILRDEITAFQQAHELMKTDQWNALPTLTQDFFKQTLYLDDNKEQWNQTMKQYLKTIATKERKQTLLMMGSSIEFPCMKMYEIFQDLDMGYFHNSCLHLPKFHKIENKSGLGLMKACFQFQYRNSFSSQTLADTNAYVFSNQISGIVYHLLKGQVSSAYEAEQMEKVAIRQNIPFICVETDYTDADKEQIKIRIEAFCEMLRTKSLQKAR